MSAAAAAGAVAAVGAAAPPPSSVNGWNPRDVFHWANILGLVHVPLFGEGDPNRSGADYAVLLDGERSSLSFFVAQDAAMATDEELSWSWSSHLHHSLIVDSSRNVLFLRRWDNPDSPRQFRLPSKPRGAIELLSLIEDSPTPRESDVLRYLLGAYRSIREALPDNDNALDSIQLFNAFLIASKAARSGVVEFQALQQATRVANILSALDELPDPYRALLVQSEAHAITGPGRQMLLHALLDRFLMPDPKFRYTLEPSLLLRHASGQLYQEAHLEIERSSIMQLRFAGLGEPTAPRGASLASDVRFTPTALARSMTQQAIDALTPRIDQMPEITILDPACGSGVFLLEVLRELIQRKFRGAITLRGFDVSDISCAMARFCLENARWDALTAGVTARVEITQTDSLTSEWGNAPDVILMNPPFVRHERMGSAERAVVYTVLGDVAHGRLDKSMAFILKGIRSLKPGGTMASVLPTSLLETSSGEKWREAIMAEAEIRLIGRFEGYGYFRSSLVEPAFFILKRREAARTKDNVVKILLSRETAESQSLRALRLPEDLRQDGDPRYEVYDVPSIALASSNWLPRWQKHVHIIQKLQLAEVPTVGDLFDVHQGALTGANTVFVISAEARKSLPRGERNYFRPCAGNSTIDDGRLAANDYVFYPYDKSGLILKTEADLLAKVPHYYRQYLLPNQTALASRKMIDQQWWRLTREREWQRENQAKLVSTYRGDRGSFAYDDDGDCVVVQGYAWFWKKHDTHGEEFIEAEEGDRSGFFRTPLPWAYLALLNSSVFESLLAHACPRVQGGQFDLSKRFVERVFLPDLSDSLLVADVVQRLARAGRAIHDRKPYHQDELEQPTARAYGLSSEEIRSMND